MNNSSNEFRDIDVCISRGSCSISPAIVSLQLLVMTVLQQTAYYILKLEQHGAVNFKIRFEIISILSALVSTNEFSQEQLYEIVLNSYYMLEESKNTYSKLSKSFGFRARSLKSIEDLSSKTTVAQAISIGETIFQSQLRKRQQSLRNRVELLLILVKSLALNLSKLEGSDTFGDEAYHEILEVLNILNHDKLSARTISEKIDSIVKFDTITRLDVCKNLLKKYGGISEVKVSHSSRPGKAILVSGNNFSDLEKVLNLTQGKNIDVYTHSNLLIAHSFNDFNSYENLIGHYGSSTENCILDFATFPGAILLTENSHNYNEFLYRGRLFSTDYIVPSGVEALAHGDFSSLIDSAQNSKGFSKGKQKGESSVGFNLQEVDELLENILSKFQYKRIYIVGVDSHLESQKSYFEKLFQKLKSNEAVISFSYSSPRENVYTINVGNYSPLVTMLLNKLFSKFDLTADNIVFFITLCDVMSISSIISLKNSGAKNIYMAPCSPMVINPSVVDFFIKEYNISQMGSVCKDLEQIRNSSN